MKYVVLELTDTKHFLRATSERGGTNDTLKRHRQTIGDEK
jgi:hypothetical protein